MSVSISSDNVMARNFFSASSEQSRYVKAKQVAAQSAVSVMASRQSSILSAGMAACASAKSMAELVLEGKKAARAMRFDMQQSVSEVSERNLKELQRHREENAQKSQQGEEDHIDSAVDTSQAESSLESPAINTSETISTKASVSSTPDTAAVNVDNTADVQPVGQNISIVV